jgi:hypothetical protein
MVDELREWDEVMDLLDRPPVSVRCAHVVP